MSAATCARCKTRDATCLVPAETLGDDGEPLELCWLCSHMICHHDGTLDDANTSPSCSCDRATIYPFKLMAVPLRPALLTFARRLTRYDDAAQDLVQDTMVRALEAWERFEPDSNLSGWLFTILKRLFCTRYRVSQRRRLLRDKHPGDALRALYGSDTGLVDTDEVTAEIDGAIDDNATNALAKLPAHQRAVVEMADLQGRIYKDIAVALDVPIGTVMSRLNRGRRALEGELEEFAAQQYGIRRARRAAGR